MNNGFLSLQHNIFRPIIATILMLSLLSCTNKKMISESYTQNQLVAKGEQKIQETKGELSPLKLRKCHNTAEVFEGQEDYRKATDKYSECCFLGNIDSCNKSGQLNLEIFNHLKAAKSYFKRACDEKNGDGCYNIFELEKEQGNDSVATIYQELACTYGVQKACIDYLKKGKIHIQKQQFQEAIKIFITLLKINPTDEKVLALRGFAYNQTAHFLYAYQDFTKAIEMNPKEPNYYASRALYHISNQDYQAAKAEFTYAIALKEKSEYYSMRGLMHLYSGSFKLAIQDSTYAINMESENLKAYVNRGTSWMHLKNYQKAVADFNHVILSKADHVFALSNRGVANQLMGKIKPAKSDFKRVLDIDNTNALMILNYLETKILTKDFDKVRAYIKRAYLVANTNEEKLLTVFMDLVLFSLQGKTNSKLEKAFNHYLKKKVLLQTNFDTLEAFFRNINNKQVEVAKLLQFIEKLKDPKLNLFYR